MQNTLLPAFVLRCLQVNNTDTCGAHGNSVAQAAPQSLIGPEHADTFQRKTSGVGDVPAKDLQAGHCQDTLINIVFGI